MIMQADNNKVFITSTPLGTEIKDSNKLILFCNQFSNLDNLKNYYPHLNFYSLKSNSVFNLLLTILYVYYSFLLWFMP